MAAGPAIGPVVGGLVIDSFGWRPMFVGIAVVALVILVGGTMMLKNVGELKNPKLNILSVILSTIAFGGLLYGFLVRFHDGMGQSGRHYLNRRWSCGLRRIHIQASQAR